MYIKLSLLIHVLSILSLIAVFIFGVILSIKLIAAARDHFFFNFDDERKWAIVGAFDIMTALISGISTLFIPFKMGFVSISLIIFVITLIIGGFVLNNLWGYNVFDK